MLLNRGDGTLEPKDDYTTAIGPVAVAAGDLDRDGHPDLVTANTSGSVSVLLNRGHGNFAREGRLRRRRRAELARARRLRRRRLPRRGRRQPARAARQARDGAARARRRHVSAAGGISAVRVFASRLTSGDLNGDGSPDLVFSDGGALAVMLNRGDATFQGPLWFGLADTLAAGDFNGDGRLDLAGAWVNDRNGAWSVTVHRNRPGSLQRAGRARQDAGRGDRPAHAGRLHRRPGSPRSFENRAPGPGRLAVSALPGQRPACGRPGVARAQPRPSLSARFEHAVERRAALRPGSSASTSSRA